MKKESFQKLVLTGVFAALSYVVFTFLQIKIPLPGGDAASNIKRRENLDFQGFWDSKAGAGGRFHPPPPKSTSNILQRRILWTTN